MGLVSEDKICFYFVFFEGVVYVYVCVVFDDFCFVGIVYIVFVGERYICIGLVSGVEDVGFVFGYVNVEFIVVYDDLNVGSYIWFCLSGFGFFWCEGGE